MRYGSLEDDRLSNKFPYLLLLGCELTISISLMVHYLTKAK